MTAIGDPSLPGARGPQAGRAGPFEMLQACHERVQLSLQLLDRLVTHVGARGRDESAQAAAHEVWRFFHVVASAHHADEETHILPVLEASGEPELLDAALQIRADHVALERIWQELGVLLQTLADEGTTWQASMLPDLQRLADAFVTLHDRHVPLEDGLAFPAAQARIDDAAQRAIGAAMAARRQA